MSYDRDVQHDPTFDQYELSHSVVTLRRAINNILNSVFRKLRTCGTLRHLFVMIVLIEYGFFIKISYT